MGSVAVAVMTCPALRTRPVTVNEAWPFKSVVTVIVLSTSALTEAAGVRLGVGEELNCEMGLDHR